MCLVGLAFRSVFGRPLPGPTVGVVHAHPESPLRISKELIYGILVDCVVFLGGEGRGSSERTARTASRKSVGRRVNSTVRTPTGQTGCRRPH